MAAKRAALFDPALAIGLARVQPAVAAWRQRRRHREAIPENLWRLVVPLAQSHGVSPVARALRLNYLALQQRTLAGHVLAAVVRVLSADWQALYHHPIYLLETFIEPERFRGTCYRAASWTYLGLTTGRGKDAPTQQPNRSLKELWVYPLGADFRRQLGTSGHG
jgi:hypothetical protein